MLLLRLGISKFWYIIFHYFRYMAVLEDTINIPLCGLFLLNFSEVCFAAFSAVTVQYSIYLSWINVNWSYIYMCVCIHPLMRTSIIENFTHKKIVFKSRMCFPTGRNRTSKTRKPYLNFHYIRLLNNTFFNCFLFYSWQSNLHLKM